MSNLFGQTLRDAPVDAQATSYQLLLRAGYLRPAETGTYTFLPLGLRTINKIIKLLDTELTAVSGQEIRLPVLSTSSPEAVIANLAHREIRSYRQFPLLLFATETRLEKNSHPGLGLLTTDEMIIHASYSLDADPGGLAVQYKTLGQIYDHVFSGIFKLPTLTIQSNPGIWGEQSQAWLYLTSSGKDIALICNSCGHAADQQISGFKKSGLPPEALLPVEKVATPNTKTIEELADYLNIPKSKTSKAVCMVAEDKLIFAIIRGDMEVNEIKLANAVGVSHLRPATQDEIKATGAVPGYASPVGLQKNAAFISVVDDIIPQSQNMVAGANQEGYHLRNINYGRDYQADIIADIAQARNGDPCPGCGQPLIAEQGVEIAKVVRLGVKLSDKMGCTFQDENRKNQLIQMGYYGMITQRLLACLVEEYHDSSGMCLPAMVTPFQVHLLSLANRDDSLPNQTAEKLYSALETAQIEVLFDDREESPGVKFNDADLIGHPLRLTVSQRSLTAGGVEFKRRREQERLIIPLEEVLEKIKAEIAT